MSLKSRLKKKYRKARESVKQFSRNTLAPIAAKVAPYKTAALAGIASYFATPAAGAAVVAGGKYIGQYWGATAARGDGLSGREARSVGRKVGDRAMKYGLVGAGVGTATALLIGSPWLGSGVATNVWAGAPATSGGAFGAGASTANAAMGIATGPGAGAVAGSSAGATAAAAAAASGA